jgi:hypothetical protein
METLILRRNYPEPVTFADLRRAAVDHMRTCPWWPHSWRRIKDPDIIARVNRWWHDAIKEVTGAHDDISVVTTTGEIRIGSVVDGAAHVDPFICARWSLTIRMADIDNLLAHADDDGYWACPHDIRLDLQSKVERFAIHRDFAHGTTAARRAQLRPFIDAQRLTWMDELDSVDDVVSPSSRDGVARIAAWSQRLMARPSMGAMSGKTFFAAAIAEHAHAEVRDNDARQRADALGLDVRAEIAGARADGESFVQRIDRLWRAENLAGCDLVTLTAFLAEDMSAGQRERIYARLRSRRLKLSGLPDYVGLEMLADFKTASRQLPGLRHSRYDAVTFDDPYPVTDIKVDRRGVTRLTPSTVALLGRQR